MPELPEVETVRRGLAPYLEGARIEGVHLSRPDLRFPFPRALADNLVGRTVTHAGRRAKYLLFTLSDGATLLSHLGMTGAWRFAERQIIEPTRYRPPADIGKHDHFSMAIHHPTHGHMHLLYADPRRFGFIDFIPEGAQSPYLVDLGPEPLGNDVDAGFLSRRFLDKKTPIKAALLDQANIAGLGNIYVCEALHRAHILPTTPAGQLVTKAGKPTARLEDLMVAIRTVLFEAIEAGGSTLRDFRKADGSSGYFQHRFSVYDREGEPCPTPMCKGVVTRIVQSGRSSFYCPVCQH